MKDRSRNYDVIVIGAGHAGCEAALASARMGSSTIMFNINLDSVALMSCNPAIGGLAKGQLVKEVDALGGEMARHRIDVDQLWSDRDPPECGGLQRGETNFPSFHSSRLYWLPDVKSNWLAGVALYYMLTGEPKALEGWRRNAE